MGEQATLVAHRITKHRGVAPILVDIDLTIGPEQRIGVIGPNGAGKSTLLRILAGLEPADSGSLALSPPTATVGYLAQEPEARPGETLGEALRRRTGVGEAERDFLEASGALASGSPEAADAYSDALERYLALGAADFEARVGETLAELGLPERLLEVPATGLSGGQRAKASLATMLLARFDLLLLDEPTNDLDFDGLERLERFLAERAGGLVVVSHDRSFLERVVTSIVEIDEYTHRTTEYGGGFTAYLQAREIAGRHASQDYEDYVGERERLRAREREQRQWGVQGTAKERRKPQDSDKAQRAFRVNRTEKQASKLRITERALERLEVKEKPYEPWQLSLDLAAAKRSGDVVFRLEAAVVERGGWRLGPIDLEVRWAERIAILGPNGAGKTTLLAALLGRLPLTEGRRSVGPSVVVGEMGQERGRFFGSDRPLIDEFLAATGLTVAEGRSLLAKFGLGASHVERVASSQSPGERTRAELALFMASGTNCLVLDEPTNHLDLAAIEQLEQALSVWPGTLLIVTHDRRLLESLTVTRRIEVADGRIVSNLAV
jgi:ATPase subunit of ABC transporter with duplicated ATPase domains